MFSCPTFYSVLLCSSGQLEQRQLEFMESSLQWDCAADLWKDRLAAGA